jgi:hypothetical protein
VIFSDRENTRPFAGTERQLTDPVVVKPTE